MKANYSDIYEGVYAEVINTNRFDKGTDISTIYIVQVNMTRNTEVNAEESFPITARGYTRGQLLDDRDCEILIDTGAGKSYISKLYFLRCKIVHTLP